MNEMVERVARALHQHIAPEAPWESLNPTHRDVACRVARAAIEAMREPTVAMVETGDNHTNCGGSCSNRAGKVAWYSMIDAVLKD